MGKRISVYDRLGEITVLDAFLQAKLHFAIEEWERFGRLMHLDNTGYVEGRMRYLRHQVAIIRQMLRDAGNPERTLRRWLDTLEMEGKPIPQPRSAGSAGTSSTRLSN